MDEDYLQLDVNILQGFFCGCETYLSAFSIKKGGLKKLVELSDCRGEKKDFMKKNDGLSMITSSSWLREITNLGISRISSRLGTNSEVQIF